MELSRTYLFDNIDEVGYDVICMRILLIQLPYITTDYDVIKTLGC